MIVCKNCGKELSDSAKFCGGCGAPVTPATSQPAPAGEPEAREPAAPVENAAPVEAPEAPVEDIPETPAEPVQAPEESVPETPAEPEFPPQAEEPTDPIVDIPPQPFQPAAPTAAPVTEEEPPAPVKKRRGKAGIAVIGLVVVVVAVVAVVLFKPFSGIGGGDKRTPAFAYLNDDNELMYLANLKEKTEALEVRVKDGVDDGVRLQFTVDGKTMYFRDDSQNLYRISVSDIKKEERPERVAKDVTGFSVLKTGNVLYTTEGSRGTELYCFNGKDDFRVSRNYDTRQLSKDQKTIYYTEKDEDDGTLTLYKAALKEDTEPQELLDGATSIYTDFDSDVLVYGEDEMTGAGAAAEDTEQNTLTVYSCKPGGEPAELVEDIFAVRNVKVDGGKVSFYYIEDEIEKYTLYDLVSDAQKSADAAVTAQDLVRPDWYNAYYPNELYEQNGAAYYRTSQGESFFIDTSELQASTGLPVAELYYYDVYNIAYSDAQERYSAALEEYDSKYDEWNAANNRNQMRESLKNESFTQHSGSLYHYTGSADSDPIATDVSNSAFISAGDGIFLYKKAAGITDSKVCDLADLSYYGEIYDYLYSGNGGGEWYQNVGDKESVLDLDEEVNVNGAFVLNSKEVVLSLSEDDDAWLDAYTVGDSSLAFADNVTDDEFANPRRGTDAKGNDVLYFFTDVESEDYGMVGDFNRYSGGKSEVLAEEVYSVRILNDSGTVYAITDRDDKGAELSLVQGDDVVTVSDEFDYNVLFFLDAKQVLYTAGGDLYLWNGKEERRIARDVETAWANAREDYTSYTPNN